MSSVTRTLGEICDEVGGIIQTGPFGSQLHRSDYKEEGTPVVMPKDLVDGKISIQSIARIDEEDVARLARHRLEEGDIVYARRGDIGRRALITAQESGWLCGTGCLRISLGDSVVVPTFLFHYLGLPNVVTWVYNQAIGATMPNLNTSIMRSVPVSYPPLPTQCKTAAILSAYDDLIENNTRRIAILEEIAQNLYREWFVHFRFPGHESIPHVDSPLGPIPEGWEVENLSALVETQYGYTESARDEEVGPKFVRGTDINKTSYIQWDSVPYCPIDDSKYLRYRLRPGDIVIIRMADPGKPGIIEKNYEAVFASYLIRLTITSSKLTSYYLFYTLLSDRYQGYITGASTGTTRKSASAGVVTGFDLLLPSEDIRRRFEEHVTALRQMLNNLLDRNANLRCTRDLLLLRLISGQLDVSDLPIDVGALESSSIHPSEMAKPGRIQ